MSAGPLLPRAVRALGGPLLAALLPAVCWLYPGPRAEDTAAPAFFEEVSLSRGVTFVHRSGSRPLRHIAETMGSGGGFLDFDRDGWLDLYLVNGGARPGVASQSPAPNQLFRNNRDGTFQDVTAAAGVGDTGYGMGCAFADYDNDGWIDIYVTNLGPNVLYRNNGDGTFSDVTSEAGVGDPLWGASAAFSDYDRDGDLDLYVCNYLEVPFSAAEVMTCPYRYSGAPNRLFRNEGGGRFSDATAQARLREDPRYSKSLGVIWLDADADGDPDLYVANDTTANYLFENRGDGTFQDISLISGTAFGASGAPQAGMGVDAADLGGGRFSLFVTNYSLQHNALYWNEGGGLFSDRIVESGLAGPSYVPLGFGTNFLDFDNDGRLDLFVANGHVLENTREINPSTEYRQLHQLFRQSEEGRFLEVSGTAGPAFLQKQVGRGSAAGDFNNDGKIDLLVTHNNGPPFLLENRTARPHQWLQLSLEGGDCNRNGIGAQVSIGWEGRSLTQEVRAGSSYLSQSDLRLHFGLGTARRVDSIAVTWPCGRKQKVAPPEGLNRRLEVREEQAP